MTDAKNNKKYFGLKQLFWVTGVPVAFGPIDS